MNRWQFAAGLGLMVASSALAGDVTVHLSDGRKVTYPSDQVQKITFADAARDGETAFCESEVRAKIVDAQLGGVINFYRRFSDRDTVEAVRRWDDGVRVVNIHIFERKIVEGRGWLVVYRGTDLRAHCGEAVLTTDQKAQSPKQMSRFEQEVRSKIADAQLGGVIGFYRQFKDPETVEAVRRWDAGVRVSNIGEFERKNVPGKGWQLVRRGTTTKADYTEFKLTTD